MLYYKSKSGDVFAFETESDREVWGSEDLVKMTDAEVQLHINPSEEPEPVPVKVTRAQGKAALLLAGLYAGVQAYADAIVDETERALAQIALNETTHWERASPFLIAAATAQGLTDEQVDQLFIQASKITL